MLTADNWCVKVDDRIYGPYSSVQLRKFASEGRLAAWSLVAPAGSRTWKEAREEAAFAAFFGVDIRNGATSLSRTFGRRDDTNEQAETPAPSLRVKVQKPSEGSSAAEDKGLANFIIIFDVVSAAASRVETAVLSLGPSFRIADNVWTVCCELTAIGVRNAIAPYLLPKESILVVDATRGRTSWQNYAPEIHAKLSSAWAGSR